MLKKITPKIRVTVWFLSAFLKKHFKAVLFSFFVSILLLLLLKSIYPVLIPIITPPNQRIGIVGNYTPSNLPLSIQSLISSGLTSITVEGSPSSGLSESWTVSEDGKIYTFVLKEGIIWHDQKTLTASDINYNLQDAIIIPKNDRELEVRLKEPYTPLPVLLSKPLFKKGLIGVGPYKVKSLKLNGDTIEYLEIVPVQPYLTKKIYKFYPTEEMAVTAFKLAEIDIIEELSDAKELQNWQTVEITERVLLNRYVGLFYNTKHEHFKDKETRQTLSLALPGLYGEKPVGPISPLSWAYYPKVKIYDKNAELAQKRLKDTPLASDSAKIIISTFENLLPTANTIVEEWKAIGVQAEVKLENTLTSDFQVLLATQEIPPDPDQYPFWHSVQTITNLTQLTNPKIDKLLEDGRVTKDQDERLQIYADFQRFLAEESPVSFLYYPRVYTVKRK